MTNPKPMTITIGGRQIETTDLELDEAVRAAGFHLINSQRLQFVTLVDHMRADELTFATPKRRTNMDLAMKSNLVAGIMGQLVECDAITYETADIPANDGTPALKQYVGRLVFVAPAKIPPEEIN